MRIVGHSRRSTKEVICKHCGTIFECSIEDNIDKRVLKAGKGFATHYSILCPTCNKNVSLGKNIDKIFPWIMADPFEYKQGAYYDR